MTISEATEGEVWSNAGKMGTLIFFRNSPLIHLCLEEMEMELEHLHLGRPMPEDFGVLH